MQGKDGFAAVAKSTGAPVHGPLPACVQEAVLLPASPTIKSHQSLFKANFQLNKLTSSTKSKNVFTVQYFNTHIFLHAQSFRFERVKFLDFC